MKYLLTLLTFTLFFNLHSIPVTNNLEKTVMLYCGDVLLKVIEPGQTDDFPRDGFKYIVTIRKFREKTLYTVKCNFFELPSRKDGRFIINSDSNGDIEIVLVPIKK